MADSDSWLDETDLPRSSRRRSLRTNHLRSPRTNPTLRRSVLSDDARDKVQDLTTSLRATSEVLTTADRMLEHYRSINNDQDEEIRRVRIIKQTFYLVKISQLAASLLTNHQQ